jgi:hypothetical protein
MGLGGKHHISAALSLGQIPSTHCVGGWVGPRAVWTGVENLAPHWDLIPGLSIPWQVAISTTLSQPTCVFWLGKLSVTYKW